MKNFFYTVIILSVVLTGCNKEKQLEESLFKEVMDIHDEVMPQMGTLRNLSKSIQSNIDSLSADSTSLKSNTKEEMKKTIEELKKANELMMEWMHQFEQIEEGTPHGEVMRYLLEQKKLIEKVREDMLKAKKKGEYYLNQ
ncbi:hypothetical protein [Reichenbachiella sp. MALMAid0571]|uniref:hypothetical protein n=1 Tax=Reichenbachiella sp. MALMAid0571 TaxID=3143939 RepID=UPI0032DF89D3